MAMDPARLPPAGLAGMDSSWSRLVPVACHDGERTFHVLDSMPDAGPETLTLLCFHGNPSWSYLWRHVLVALPELRVVAMDHLDMGFSERTGSTRRLANRIADASALTETLGVTGRVVTVAHDWGGPISLGWALAHREQLDGVILTNTAVHQPNDASAPKVIRAIRNGPFLRRTTVGSTGFITGALEMSRPRLSNEIRDGFLAPYKTTQRRQAIKTFVEDIPLESTHPTAETLDGIADGLNDLASVPSLLLWGAKDPVFGDLYLHDLESRLPHADVHRWPNAGHFVTEDAPVADAISLWLSQHGLLAGGHAPTDTSTTAQAGAAAAGAAEQQASAETSTLLHAIDDPSRSDTLAVTEMGSDGASIDFGELSERVANTAAAFESAGVAEGDRIAIMIPPGVELVVAVYGAWRAGAVAVLVDGALTPPQMGAALKSASPAWLVGIPKALAAARTLRWPGTPIVSERLSRNTARALGSPLSLPELCDSAADPTAETPLVDDLAAVVFTSGSTGPSKGVLYTHGQLAAQRDAIKAHYGITVDCLLYTSPSPRDS